MCEDRRLIYDYTAEINRMAESAAMGNTITIEDWIYLETRCRYQQALAAARKWPAWKSAHLRPNWTPVNNLVDRTGEL